MSFVAEPYDRFVDDLLTALTGGVTREEHLFTGADAPYSLASPGVVPSSLRVFGQRNDAFVVFDPGIDYAYNAADEAIVWKPNGKLPDDHSYFYANYYLQEGIRRLTDRNPGSVNTTLSEAFAREMAVLHKQMQMIYESAFLDLAEGSALDHVVALLGLERRDAKFASGEAIFKRTTPAPGDIAIPAGTLVSTDQGQNFETTDKRTLRKGQLSITVPIRAQVEGPPGKVAAGTIKNVNRPIFGIDAVVNDRDTFFANQKETDEELRRRMRGTLERAGKSTVDAIKYALIEDIAEITDTNIQIAERPETPGLVEVRLGLESAGDADLVRRVEESIFYARPAGVRVVHNLPTGAGTGGAAGGITRPEAAGDFGPGGTLPGAARLPAEVVAAMPQGVLDLRIEVFLRLAEANLSASQKETLEDGARSTIVDFVGGLPMGAPLVYAKLLGRIVAPDGIVDAAMQIGAERNGEFVRVQGNLDTEGRKARIDPNRIFVGLMDEVVKITLTVTVEAKAGTTAAPEALRQLVQKGGALYAGVEAGVRARLDAARTTGSLAQADLTNAIRPLVDGAGLQFVEARGVALSAEYVETGRLVNNTDQLALADNELPVLDSLVLKLKGDLDV